MTRILLADDEENLREAVSIILRRAGYDVSVATDGTQTVERFVRDRPDLVIMDVMMPWMDGYQACERIRAIAPDVPVLMLTAKGDIVDKKIGFHAGADDYMVKPFNDEELLLRVEALLRRRGRGDSPQPSAVGQPVTIGDMVIDPRRYEVTVSGRAVQLTPKEFQLIATMAESPGKVFTREDLIELVWGSDYDSASVSIPVYIRRIREKVEPEPSNPVYIQTVWGFGYRLGEG